MPDFYSPNAAHFDGNQIPTIMGVIGTLGTADVKGTAAPLPFAVDPTTGAMITQELGGGFSVFNSAGTAGTNTIKTTAGFLHTVTINTPVASDVITIFNGTSTNPVAKITLPATLLMEGPNTAIYDIPFTNGLTLAHTGTSDITVSYR